MTAGVFKPRFRAISTYIAHQVMSTYGSMFLAAFGTYSLAELLSVLHVQVPSHLVSRLLTETHFYPIQIASSLLIGLWMARRLPNPRAAYSWVLPLLLLSYCMSLAEAQRTDCTELQQ